MKDTSNSNLPLYSALGPVLGKPDKNILWELIYGKKETKTPKK